MMVCFILFTHLRAFNYISIFNGESRWCCRHNGTSTNVILTSLVTGPKKGVFRVQLDECKLQNGHADTGAKTS